jgi:chaperonin GroES
MQTYSPLEDRVLVRPIVSKEPEKTDGGLFIPTSAKKEVAYGEVVSVGPGRYASETGTFMPTVLGKGDTILYGIGNGMPVSIENGEGREEVLLMREPDILLLVSKKEVT